MENPYITQFPDLMSGKKIMYVHGFLSSGQSGTVKMLQELMPKATLVAEDIPVHPEEAMEMLHKMQETEKPDLIIGTSMGGMYTDVSEPAQGWCARADGDQGTHQGIPRHHHPLFPRHHP